MNRIRYILPAVLLTLLAATASAQITRPEAEGLAREELQRRGLTEEEVRARLLQRGIDIDNIDPAELPALQQTIEEVLRELEQEKRAAQPRDTVPAQPRDTAPARVEPPSPPPPAPPVQEEAADPDEIYGHAFFRNRSIQLFRVSEDVQPPDSYVLGPGDELTVSIFGPSQADFQFTVNAQGFISPPGMPRIFLQGVSYGQARELIRSRFAQAYVFRPGQFAVGLTQARNITVNIFGELRQPGSYTIPATNTAFNALVAAGGPAEIGSVRRIRLQRGGESRRVDLYAFAADPGVQYDFFLRENDILYVPVAERVVSIRGAVRRPMRYELLEGEQLRALLDFAGGLTDDAYRELIQVRRYINDEQVLIDLNLRALLAGDSDFALLGGDEVLIRAIPGAPDNFVSIEGAVRLPGEYALTAGMRVRDLLARGELQPGARTDLAFLLRRRPDGNVRLLKIDPGAVLRDATAADNLVLQPEDRLLVYASSRFADRDSIQVAGAVREPTVYRFAPAEGITVEEAILLAGGLRPDALGAGYIIRSDPGNPEEKTYLRVDLRAALADPGGPANLRLLAQDELRVLAAPTFTDEAGVQISGAVRLPGEYRYGDNLSLAGLLTLAGGLQLQAASNRIEVFRVVISDNQPTRTVVYNLQVDEDFNVIDGPDGFQLQPYDQVVVRQVPEFEFQQNVRLEGEVRYPGVYALTSDNERVGSLIERAGGLSPEAFPEGATLFRNEDGAGYIVTRLDEVIDNPGSRYNFILKDGDIVSVPKRRDLVTIRTGGTRADELYADKFLENGQVNVAFHKGKNAKWYLDEYTVGLAEQARKRLITVEHPNGQIERTRQFLFFKNYPKVRKGSIVSVGIVPPKPEREKTEREPVDWPRVIANTLAQVTAVLSIVVLVQQID